MIKEEVGVGCGEGGDGNGGKRRKGSAVWGGDNKAGWVEEVGWKRNENGNGKGALSRAEQVGL